MLLRSDPNAQTARIPIMFDTGSHATTLDRPVTPVRLPPAFMGAVQVRPGRKNKPERSIALQPQETDSELMTRHLIAVRDHRDRTAFAALFDYYAPRLRAMLMRSNCNAATADDIVQEALLRVWHKSSQFDPGMASASAWIYRIARNRHVDVVRRTSRPVPEALRTEDPPEPSAEQQLGIQAEAVQLRAALAALNPEQRRMVEAAYMGDLTHAEISDRTGLPLGTVKSRIRLALDRLRHELKDLRPE